MKITLFDSNGHRPCQSAELTELLTSEDHLVWADIIGPTEDDIRIMRDVFNFHPLAIEDTRNHEQRPKVEEYPGYLFLIVNPVEMTHSGEDLNFHELDIFVGRNYVVTVHTNASPVIDRVHERVKQTTVSRISVGYLMYVLLDVVVDGYFPIMDMVEEEINQLEDVILSRPRQDALARVFTLKRMLLHLWRVVWPERDILSTLTQPHIQSIADRDTNLFYLRDVADHLYWIADMIGTYRDTLTSVIDLYMSSVSNRLNRVVNRLTVITMGFGLLAVITGFYGMNFENTWPDFHDTSGVRFVLVLIGLVSVGIIYVLRRLDDY